MKVIDDFIKRYEIWAKDDQIEEAIRKEHSKLVEYLKDYKRYIETSEISNDIIINIRNDREKDIAKIVFRNSGYGHYNISEDEINGCFVYDIDRYNDNETTYKIDLNHNIDTLENCSNDTLISELKSRLKD